MKQYHARVTYFDRKLGPNTGSTFKVSGSDFHIAASRAAKQFTRNFDRKQMNDVRQNGLTIYLLPVPERVDESPSTEETGGQK